MAALGFGVGSPIPFSGTPSGTPPAGGFGYSSGSAHTTLPTEPTLPDWLPTDPNALSGELMDQYNSVNNFGANKAARAIDRTGAINKSMGLGAANAAASDYTARLMQAGGTAFASGAVKAQAMMPVLRDAAATEERKQKMLMDARKTAASMRQNLAGQLASSRSQYLGTLAGTYTTMRGQNIQYEESQNALGASSGGGDSSASMGQYGGTGNMPYNPGYIPNQGAILPSTGWAGANNHNVLLDPTIPMRMGAPPRR